MITPFWPMMITLSELIHTQHQLIQKIGLGLTMAGSGFSLTAATQLENITMFSVSGSLDEWKVWGIVFGMGCGGIGLVVQVVGMVLTHRHRRRSGADRRR